MLGVVPEDEGPTSLIETANSSGADGTLSALRWLHPRRQPPTILSDVPVSFGRDPNCSVQLDDPRVSRRHAEVRRVADVHLICDTGSKNGVFVNGARVDRAILSPGDLVRLGYAVAVFEEADSKAPEEFGDLAHGLWGGAQMAAVVARAKAASTGTLNIVLQGETGSGKAHLARAIHGWSGRPGPLVSVSCAAFPERGMLELTASRTGTHSAAVHGPAGSVRAAQNGTVLLGDVLELSLPNQLELLRLIKLSNMPPDCSAPPDVRFLATTHTPLHDAAADRMRLDLRVQLEGMVIEVPPLRARRSDILPLFVVFLDRLGGSANAEFDADFVERLCLYDWPMNVRELENVARRIRIAYPAQSFYKLSHLLDVLPAARTKPRGEQRSEPPAMVAAGRGRRRSLPYQDGEITRLLEAIERHGGNLSRAASELGITRPKAYRLLSAAKSGAQQLADNESV
jgi:DNA-binding NtrC family response regulator